MGERSERLPKAFDQNQLSSAQPIDIKTLNAKLGELTLENYFLEGVLTKVGMLSANHKLSVTRTS